jgi:hypothetical protein
MYVLEHQKSFLVYNLTKLLTCGLLVVSWQNYFLVGHYILDRLNMIR